MYKILTRERLIAVKEQLEIRSLTPNKINKDSDDLLNKISDRIEKINIVLDKLQKWNQKYEHILPIENWSDYIKYIDFLEREEYEKCNEFKIID